MGKELFGINDGKFVQITEYGNLESARYFNIKIGGNGLPMRQGKNDIFVDCANSLPVLYTSREECCGCGGCMFNCPVNDSAITMVEDDEGFLYPVIDAARCLRCGKCVAACQFKL